MTYERLLNELLEVFPLGFQRVQLHEHDLFVIDHSFQDRSHIFSFTDHIFDFTLVKLVGERYLLVFCILNLFDPCQIKILQLKLTFRNLLKKPIFHHRCYLTFTFCQLLWKVNELLLNLTVQSCNLSLQISDQLFVLTGSSPLVKLVIDGAHVIEAPGWKQVVKLNCGSVICV